MSEGDSTPRPPRPSERSFRRPNDSPNRRTLRGLCASPGIAVGPVTIFDRRSVPIPRRTIGSAEIEAEEQRLMQALATSRRHLEEARDALDPVTAVEHRWVLEAHLLMHRDELLVGEAVAAIRKGLNAEWAVRSAVEAITRRLASAREPYLSERVRDVEQVGEHVLRVLTGTTAQLPSLDRPTILIASDLTPAEAARLPRDRVLALVTDGGSSSSHVAILARALGIPAVVGVEGVTRTLSPGDRAIVDALRGEIVVEPDEDETRRAEERARRYRLFTRRLRSCEGAPSATADGTRVELCANVELEAEVEQACAQLSDGIGLCRTELLCLHGEPPSEEEQAALYARIAARCSPRTATLRTFDFGADKLSAWGDPATSCGANPALGLRGLRLSLALPELLRTQIRAMLRAASAGPVRILFPMVCTLDDWSSARAIVGRAQRELEAEGVPHRSVPLGAMIEVPSAVIMADALARECDFFSVGTNDLTQYTLAVDRHNPRVSNLVRALEPALLRMLDIVRRAAARVAIPVSVCGDLAAHPMAIPVLVGLGYRSLSVPPVAIPVAREVLRRIEIRRCEELARDCLDCGTGAEVERRVGREMRDDLGDIWEEQGIEIT